MSNTRECIHQQASIYKKLSDELLCEEIIESEHRQLMSRKELLAVEIGAKQTDVIALEAQSKKEYNNVRMLRHFSLKSAAATLSGRKKEVAAKEEGKYHLAFENEQRAKRELEAKQSEYAEILKAENTYSSQRAHFHHIRDQLNILLDEIFAHNTNEFPIEKQIREELANYNQQNSLAIRDRERFVDSERELSNVLVEMNKLLRLLDISANYNTFEIFGGQIIDQQQVRYMESAQKRIGTLQNSLNRVRTILPEIPHPQTLDLVTNNNFISMYVTVSLIDMNWRDKTRACLYRVIDCQKNIQRSLQWVQQYRQYAEGATNRLAEVIITTRHRLFTERCSVVESVLSGQNDRHGVGSSTANDALFSTENDNEVTPPVYEAPTIHVVDSTTNHPTPYDNPSRNATSPSPSNRISYNPSNPFR